MAETEKKVAIGIDAGFASTGISVVEVAVGGGYQSLHLECFKTTPFDGANKKQRHGIRKTDDDARRIKLIVNAIDRVCETFKPDFGGLESFSLLPGKGMAWKTALAFSSAIAVLELRKIPIYIFNPGDIKVFAGKKTASKEEVRDTISFTYLWGIDWGKIKGDHEHLGDATALAIMTLKEVSNIRRQLGME